MPVQTACTSCSAKLKIKDELIGKSIKCPKCSTIFKAAAELETATVASRDSEAAKPAAVPTQTATADKPAGKKPPPPAWDNAPDEDDEDDKPKKKSTSRAYDDEDDEDDKPKRKPTPKTFDDDGEGEDRDEEAAFKDLLAQATIADDTKKQIKADLGLREKGIWLGQPDPKIMAVRALGKSAIGVFISLIFCIVFGVMGSGRWETGKFSPSPAPPYFGSSWRLSSSSASHSWIAAKPSPPPMSSPTNAASSTPRVGSARSPPKAFIPICSATCER